MMMHASTFENITSFHSLSFKRLVNRLLHAGALRSILFALLAAFVNINGLAYAASTAGMKTGKVFGLR